MRTGTLPKVLTLTAQLSIITEGTGQGSRLGFLEGQMERIFIQIAGMSCEGCVNSVRNALARVPGVQVDQVKLGTATVRYDPAMTDPERVHAAIEKAGFKPHP